MNGTKTVYVVRKHIVDAKSKKEIRFEDYPNQFNTWREAIPLLLGKERKYHQTVNDLFNDDTPIEAIPEGRWYEIVLKNVPA